jgi:hypothetical protein
MGPAEFPTIAGKAVPRTRHGKMARNFVREAKCTDGVGPDAERRLGYHSANRVQPREESARNAILPEEVQPCLVKSFVNRCSSCPLKALCRCSQEQVVGLALSFGGAGGKQNAGVRNSAGMISFSNSTVRQCELVGSSQILLHPLTRDSPA